ncbi:MAG TPA: adenylate/guanylate cyclase domain-containing protein [Lacipirellulaceae bacterium]|nr:adenylate/guanylate cyclase domain-containing protein [Lacipirellulaceae bacterium]
MPTIMAQARTDVDLAAAVVELLLKSLPGSLAAAVVQFQECAAGEAAGEPTLIRWSSREGAVQRFRPSRRLMRQAIEEQRSVVHLWSSDDGPQGAEFTMSSDLDWAFCTQIPSSGREQWCLYVSGRRQCYGYQDIASPTDLLNDLRLAELMAKFIGAVRQVRALEHVHTEMCQFFSPAVVETLVDDRCATQLEPREGLVSVLFCDVRGFSRKVERSRDDLHRVLRRVREALSVMTRAILKYEGVIADFQGDAALAFWGWPAANEESAALACRTALAIHQAFVAAQEDRSHPLYGFRVGIGIGHGEAIAGRIGSDEQIKVGVFGPVVNVAARLQDLSKAVGEPILIDGATASSIAGAISAEEAVCRAVARVRPPGLEEAVEVFALTPVAGMGRIPRGEELRQYYRARRAIERGDWAEAREWLRRLPQDDGPTNFLRMALRVLGFAPPADWDGVIPVGPRGTLCSAESILS